MPEDDGLPAYTLGSTQMERERLLGQADDLLPHSEALFARVGVGPGWETLDLGCGPSGNLRLLAELTAPGGHVLGLDVDPEHVRLACAFAAARGLINAGAKVADARATSLPDGSFDLVHARLLLINIPWPAQVVTEMTRLARPGGWVTGEEADGVFICYPPHPAWDRLVEVLRTAWRADRADINIGRQLTGLYRAAGLQDVGVQAFADVHPPGHRRRMIVPDLVCSLRPKILERGLVRERELDELDEAVRAHIDDHRTVMLPILYFIAWGRRPAAE